MRTRIVLALCAALMAASAAEAKDETCSDGSNCLCDKISQQDPNVVFCEDFEASVLDQNGSGGGWTEKYGAPVDGCWQKGLPSGQWVKTVEGTCSTCCMNVVKESACEVSGQGDCVFQGTQSFGHRYRPGQTGGVVGSRALTKGNNFGVTMAVKFSRNFVNAASPKKTNEFGPPNHCILGCSSGTYVSMTNGVPFHGVLFWDTSKSAPTWRNVVGRGGYSGVAFGWYPSVPNEYDFNRDHGLDSWHCWRLHISNVGKAGARIRHWIDNKLMVELADVDLRNMLYADRGFDGISFNNYYNNGYPGSSVAYRYEDNVVVTTGSEPVSCSAIGFDFGGGLPDDPEVGVPGQPQLVQ